MKLIRFGPQGAEKPGIETADGRRYDVSAFCSDYDQAFFEGEGPSRLAEWSASQGNALPALAGGERLGPPIANPSKIICVGLNYAKHAHESKMERPKEPVLFFKSSTAITGPFDPILNTPGETKTEWEV